MKKAVFILLCILPISASAQVNDLIGTWTWIEHTQIDFGNLPWTITEDEFKAEGRYTAMTFMEDNKVYMINKLHDIDTTKSFLIWRATKDTLSIIVHVEQNRTVNWLYELREDKLILTLYSPDGKNKIVNTWREK